MAEGYRSALALEQAVKAATRKSGQDVGRAVEGFGLATLIWTVSTGSAPPS